MLYFTDYMIIAVIGEVGSGKSVTATKKILESPLPAFVNYNVVSKRKDIFRLKKDDIVLKTESGQKKTGEKKYDMSVNWSFWNTALDDYGNYNLCLDEVHNLVHSRRSMDKFNVFASIWISQIRKILGESETSNIYLITQKLQRLDSTFRDLLNQIIYCEKIVDNSIRIKTKCYSKGNLIIKNLPAIYIKNTYFTGSDCDINFNDYFVFGRSQKGVHSSMYLANPFFRFYNSYELFGESSYL